MDPKLIFWTGAFLNMCAVVAFASAGVRQRRRGDIARHRRSMLTASGLVAFFLVSYLLKVPLLGRENLEVWSASAVWTLRIHETCIAVMLIAGGMAGRGAYRLRATRNATRRQSDPPAPPPMAARHRRAGWTAVVAAVLGLVSAAGVLLGMYERTAG